MGKSEVPFWMRMEIFSCQSRLTHARHDIAQCYHAVFGDVHWNPTCFAVYAALARGQSPWFNERGSTTSMSLSAPL